MTSNNNDSRLPTREESAARFKDMEAAMRRAAIEARRRAIETSGSVATWRNGRIEYDTEV